MYQGRAVFIPSAIGGLPVVGVGANAFFDNIYVSSVTIPDSVRYIGVGAFEYCFLTSVTLSLGLTDIESNVFYDCNSLTSVITLPNGVTNIGGGAFWYCSLTSISIPASVTNIGVGAFEDCYSLTAINVDSGNPAYASVGGVLFNKSGMTLLQFPGGLGGSYAIPLGVNDIESNAFFDCGLTSVTIPASVTTIGVGGFAYCKLTNVTLSLGLTDIESGAFDHCGLVNVTIPASVTNIGADAFYRDGTISFLGNAPALGQDAIDGTVLYLPGATGFGTNFAGLPTYLLDTNSDLGYVVTNGAITVIVYVGSGGILNIPSTIAGLQVTQIGASALANTLTALTIPASVTNIAQWAFQHCGDLTAINVDSGNPAYASVGGVLFNKSGMTLVEFPQGLSGSYAIPLGVTDIESNAFSPCALTSAIIPNSVTNIGDAAFFFGNLSGIYFQGNAPSVGLGVFDVDPATAYYLPGTTGWSEFATKAGIPTKLWTLPNPLVLSGSLGIQINQFAFTISWATNVPVVVEACEDITHPVWTPIATNTLTGGTSYFSDPQWTKYPARFYRLSQ